MLKPKLQYFGHLMWAAYSLQWDPDAGKHWKQKKGAAEDEMVREMIGSMDMSLSKLWEMVKDREAWHATVHGVTKS